MDPRRPLSNASVHEEFIHFFYSDLERRPLLKKWLEANYPPSVLRDLSEAIETDSRALSPKYGYAITARLKAIGLI